MWEAFELSKSLAIERVGVDGTPIGIDIIKARSCFDAAGEPWDVPTLKLFEHLASGFADELARTRKK